MEVKIANCGPSKAKKWPTFPNYGAFHGYFLMAPQDYSVKN